MVSGDWQMIGFRSYLSKKRQFFQLVTQYRSTSLLLAEFLRNQCQDPCCFNLTILIILDPILIFIFMLMISIYFVLIKATSVQRIFNNNQLCNINEQLCANNLSLKTDESNFVVFHLPQKELTFCISLKIYVKVIMQKNKHQVFRCSY